MLCVIKTFDLDQNVFDSETVMSKLKCYYQITANYKVQKGCFKNIHTDKSSLFQDSLFHQWTPVVRSSLCQLTLLYFTFSSVILSTCWQDDDFVWTNQFKLTAYSLGPLLPGNPLQSPAAFSSATSRSRNANSGSHTRPQLPTRLLSGIFI